MRRLVRLRLITRYLAVLAAFAHPMTAMPGIPDNHFRIRFSGYKVIIFWGKKAEFILHFR
jgi:hypothetical protein